jgi:hypothetical protein
MTHEEFLKQVDEQVQSMFKAIQQLNHKVEMQNGFKEEDRKKLAELKGENERYDMAMKAYHRVIYHPDCDPDAPVPKEIIDILNDILNPKERLRTEKEQSQDNKTRPGK